MSSLTAPTTCYPKVNNMIFLFQAISVTQAGKPEEKLELAFRLYDIDRNGCIEQSEMTEIIKVRKYLIKYKIILYINKIFYQSRSE